MNAYQLFIVLLLCYISLLIFIGWRFNKKQRSLSDFFLAGKAAGTLSIGFSAAASWLTAGALLAVIGFFMLLGMGSVWGFVAPNIIALFIIAFFVKKIKNLPSITQPELLELRYGSFLRVPVAIIITVVMVLFAVADIKGFAMVLEIFYGVSPLYSALIVGVAVCIYVTLGGLSAVIATDIIQFIFLSVFVIVMAVVVMGGASSAGAVSFTGLLTAMPESWWNPVSIGGPMVLIFLLAIVPGWITEQDPWQKIWAAKDERSARNGMFLGSLLVAIVFGGCALIAVGLNAIYPEIAKAGFPMGMAKAEPALLTFIMNSHFSDFALALCGVGLATAAMSCTDTFAASGASCLSRDIYQRYLHPDATMKQMLKVNRVSVLLIVGLATLGSFFIKSIIDAIHIATFIASASYFFVLMGGLYWKRANRAGAVASLCTGFLLQVAFVIIDVVKTAPMSPPFLETIHPLFMGHGVIFAMGFSGLAFVSVSLLTEPSPGIRLAPFFKDEAELMISSALNKNNNSSTDTPGNPGRDIRQNIEQNRVGDLARLHLNVELVSPIEWKKFVGQLKSAGDHWISIAGSDSVRRFTNPDFSYCVSLTRGKDESSLWFEAETAIENVNHLKQDVCLAYGEVQAVLNGSSFKTAVA